MFDYDFKKYYGKTLVASAICGSIIGLINYVLWRKHRDQEIMKETFMNDLKVFTKD